MRKEQFHQCLAQLTEFIEDASDMLVVKHPDKVLQRRLKSNKPEKTSANERSKPTKGYTVVLSHKPKTWPCEWCEGQCSNSKTYSRSPGSKVWNAKCGDCGEKRRISPGFDQEK